MSLSVSSLNGNPAAGKPDAVDFSKLPVDPKKIAPGKPPSGGPGSSPVRAALGPKTVALMPEEVKRVATSFLPMAQKIVDSTFGSYIKVKPEVQLKLWSTKQMRANMPGENIDRIIAYTDTGRPRIVNVAFESPMFKKLNVDTRDLHLYLVHEVMHTRSAAFSVNIAETYGKPLANGKPATFSDGSQVRGITEGLTERYTLMATSQETPSSTYGREIKWADKLAIKVGPETMAKAYFGNDADSMVQVKKAINELIAADKQANASARSH